MKIIQQSRVALGSPIQKHSHRIGIGWNEFWEVHEASHELSALLDVINERLKDENINDDTLCLVSLAYKTSLTIADDMFQSAKNLPSENQDAKDEQTREA